MNKASLLILFIIAISGISAFAAPLQSEHYIIIDQNDELPAIADFDQLESLYNEMKDFLGFSDPESPFPVKLSTDTEEVAAYLEFWQDDSTAVLVICDLEDRQIIRQMAAMQILKRLYPHLPQSMENSLGIFFQFEGSSYPRSLFLSPPQLLDLYNRLTPDESELYLASESALQYCFLFSGSGREGLRLFWEAVTLGKEDRIKAAEAQNALSAYLSKPESRLAFTQWLSSQPRIQTTFNKAVEAYNRENYEESESLFQDLFLVSQHFQIPYYLGLIAFETDQFEAAIDYFRTSMEYGAPEALINYSTGLALWELESYEDARLKLYLSASQDPDNYSEAVGKILNY